MTSSRMLLFCLASVLPGLVITLVATYGIRAWAPRLGLLDKPNARKVHTNPIPLGGGIAIWLGLVLPLALGNLALWLAVSQPEGAVAKMVPEFARVHLSGAMHQMPKLWGLVGAATGLMLLGLADDRVGLPWQVRLVAEVGIATMCVIGIDDLQLTAFIEAPWLTVPLSVFWIVALINSFNMLDNMDALSGGIAVIVSGILAAIMLLAPDPVTAQPQLFVAGFLLLLVGSLLGFLWHNRPPAKIFMGDAGAYLIGFWVAIATLLASYASYKADARHAVITPLCVMAVPLYDLVTVMTIRLLSGNSPFHADKNHFSHRLVDLGLTKPQAVATVHLTTATCGLGALLLYQVNQAGAVIIVLLIVCVLAVIAIIETAARRTIRERDGK